MKGFQMRLSRTAAAASMIIFFSASQVFSDAVEILSSQVPMAKEYVPMREINIKAGFDFDGKYDFNTDAAEKLYTGNSVSFAAEYVRYFNDYVGAGGGISAQIPRAIDNFSGKFGFAPVYLSLKVRSWPIEPGLYSYVLGQLGYGFFYGDLSFTDDLSVKKGGFYYGAGLGIIYKVFLIEVMFTVNSGVMEDSAGGRKNIDYGKFTVFTGYRL
jgi:hypothetical protein